MGFLDSILYRVMWNAVTVCMLWNVPLRLIFLVYLRKIDASSCNHDIKEVHSLENMVLLSSV